MVETTQCDAQRTALAEIGRIQPASLFINHGLLETHNPSRARSSVEGVFFKHRLRTCLGSPSVNFVHRGAALGALTFNLISYGADVEVSVNDINRSHYVAVLPLSGRAAVRNHDQEAEISCGSIVMLDPQSRFRFEMEGDHCHLAIGIPKTRLNRHLISAGQMSGRLAFLHRPYRIEEIGSGLFGLLAFICSEVDRPGSILTQNTVTASLEETFLSMLVSSLLKGELYTGNARNALPLVPLCVQKAEAFMEENLLESIRAEDIAEAAEVPVRTLYQAYQKYRGLSPLAWLKIRRLRQARFDLLDPQQSDVSVTEISHRYQQFHVGRFSRAYFEEFGEYPSETGKR